MSRVAAGILLLSVAVLLLSGVIWAWRRRSRRDSAFSAPFSEIPVSATVGRRIHVMYVATTAHDNALERLAIRGLKFRSRADLILTDLGVAIDLDGQKRMFLNAERIKHVDRATLAIDRVVEPDGLVRVAWLVDENTMVDTFLRPVASSPGELVAAITTFSATTGSDA